MATVYLVECVDDLCTGALHPEYILKKRPRGSDFICADDETAKERAKLLSKSHDVELWQLDRKVAFLTVDPSPLIQN